MSKQQTSWKSPNDEMPPEEQPVLARLNEPLFGGMNFQVAILHDDRWYFSNGHTFVETSMLPAHWMSIPPLPGEVNSSTS